MLYRGFIFHIGYFSFVPVVMCSEVDDNITILMNIHTHINNVYVLDVVIMCCYLYLFEVLQFSDMAQVFLEASISECLISQSPRQFGHKLRP